jgi:hypothetical protein
VATSCTQLLKDVAREKCLISYFIDVTLQLVNSDARHRAMWIAWRWRDEPIAVFTPSFVAGFFYIVSTHTMVSRVTLGLRGESKFSLRQFASYLACAIGGAVLMIFTSQSIWYSWNGTGGVATFVDRPMGPFSSFIRKQLDRSRCFEPCDDQWLFQKKLQLGFGAANFGGAGDCIGDSNRDAETTATMYRT